MSFRILDYGALQRLQEPPWLVDQVIPIGEGGSLGVLFGRPGSGKSFVALDIAHCVGTNTDWHGRRVQQGSVVYLAAEGALGFKSRAAAWAKSHGIRSIQHAHYVLDPINLMDLRSVEAFLRTLRDEMEDKPILVVIDTLARSMAGGDENETRDMSAVVTGLGRIQTLGCSVLVVHHQGHNDDAIRARGSSVLPAAADYMLRTAKTGRTVRLECAKQKDAEEFTPLKFELKAYDRSAVLIPESQILRFPIRHKS